MTDKFGSRLFVVGFNLGLRTGEISNLTVLDDDTEDHSAAEKLKLPKTVTAITGRNRPHYYFNGVKGIGNSANRLMPHVDVRGEGGQVVFPGSIHPDTGKEYSWAPGLSPADVPVADLPQEIIDKLKRDAS